jgi:hypothetical protein
MWPRAQITSPRDSQLKAALAILRTHNGLPVKPESGAGPREVRSGHGGEIILVSDPGIVAALVDRGLAYWDHDASVLRPRHPKAGDKNGI